VHLREREAEASQYCRSYPSNTSLMAAAVGLDPLHPRPPNPAANSLRRRDPTAAIQRPRIEPTAAANSTVTRSTRRREGILGGAASGQNEG
jgi:hypothetical protein